MAKQKDSMDGFWERIEAEIRIQKKSKKRIAEKCGFDRKVFYGRRNLSSSYLARLCLELKC